MLLPFEKHIIKTGYKIPLKKDKLKSIDGIQKPAKAIVSRFEKEPTYLGKCQNSLFKTLNLVQICERKVVPTHTSSDDVFYKYTVFPGYSRELKRDTPKSTENNDKESSENSHKCKK